MPRSKNNGNQSSRLMTRPSELAHATRILHKHLPELRNRYHVSPWACLAPMYAASRASAVTWICSSSSSARPLSWSLFTSSGTSARRWESQLIWC